MVIAEDKCSRCMLEVRVELESKRLKSNCYTSTSLVLGKAPTASATKADGKRIGETQEPLIPALLAAPGRA